MPDKILKVPQRLTREAARAEVNGETVTMSISSDIPYLRESWYEEDSYWEVLDHSPGGVDEERLKAGLPILYNHDRNALIGRAQTYANDGHKITVTAKFSESPLAKEKFADVKSGVLVDTSVGYEIIGEGICIGAKEEKPIYKFRFKIYEGSLVSIPADATVGVGRHRDKSEGEPREILIRSQETIDSPTNQPQTRSNSNPPMAEIATPPPVDTKPAIIVDAKKERAEALSEFKLRCKKIDEWCDPAKNPAMKNERWHAAALKVAATHKDGEAIFDDFRTEALGHFTSENVIDTPEGGEVRVIGDRPQNPGQRSMSVGEAFVKSKQFKAAASSREQGQRGTSMEFPGVTMLGVRGKASLQQRAGWNLADLSAVSITTLPGMIQLGVQQLTVMDLLPGGAIANGALVYPRENGFGTVNGVTITSPRAQTVGVGGLKPNWDPDLTTETASVKKIAITTKVPDEMMSDHPMMQSFIDARLPYMVDLETEFQILYGDGLGNNLKGIFTNGDVQTRNIVATDGTTIAESLKKGLTDIRVGSRFIPTGFAFHPYDWETASLLKDSEGRFLAGGPFYAPFGVGMFVEVNTFWGKPVVVSDSVTEGQPVAGAWNMGAQYFMREGMQIATTDSNEDDWRRNLICVRAEHRLALATYRPVAFLEFQNFPARS